jgi:uncharacterized protein (TIGR02302 family)
LLRRARLALLWEAAWPPVALAGALVLLFLAISWLGLWEAAPRAVRIIGVLAFAGALGAALYPLLRLRVPTQAQLLARIDRASGQAHRPATTLAEPLANEAQDPVTRALWDAHRTRTARTASGLNHGGVHPRVAQRDPLALRFLPVLVAVVGFAAAGGDHLSGVRAAFDWSGTSSAAAPPRLDAWVTPPGYTGRPPVFLTAARPVEDGAAAIVEGEESFRVPAGSILVIRTSGGEARVEAGDGARPVEDDAAATPRGTTPPAVGVRQSQYALDRDATVTAHADGSAPYAWRFAVVPDAAPTIAFTAPPGFNDRGALLLGYRAGDDYGLTGATVQVERVPADPREATVPARPLYGPPDIRLALPATRGGSGEASTIYDGLEHPWAGARVAMTLVARDEAGQEGRSETQEAVLPARAFSHPVAKALIEQRRILALDARARERVAGAIDALSLYPDKFSTVSGVYLGLRAGYWRVTKARNDDELRSAADYLWEMAVALEEGDLQGLDRELKDAEQALRDALERNAPDEEIKRLMDELRAALGRFMEEFARRMEQQPQRQTAMPPNARVLTPEDLKRMMDQLENRALSGDKQSAKDMLAQLRDMLENLQRGQTAQGQSGEGEQDPQSQALDELGRMIREQSELRDRTFQQRQDGNGQQEGQKRPGQQGKNGQQPGAGELSQQQGALRQRLQELMRQMEGQGLEGEGSLGEAGEAMGRAQGQLGQGNAEGAVGQQGQALDALRQGARSMAERMQQGEGRGQGQAQGQQPGRRGQAAQGEDTDPLGRPTRNRRYDPGSSVRVPGEIEAQRARRVLEELRRRVGEPSRPQEELDYLDRLLRD